jgi:hypothetical protein
VISWKFSTICWYVCEGMYPDVPFFEMHSTREWERAQWTPRQTPFVVIV